MPPKTIIYVTSSRHKQNENLHFVESKLRDGRLVKDIAQFDLRSLKIKEVLDVDLAVVVQAEAIKAYEQIQTPCIVEHAGLIFDRHSDSLYPGGLTKAMWNALGDNFVLETSAGGQGATARAVVAYCDGMTIKTFVGDTHGTIASAPRGSSDFYWDTIFIPDDLAGASGTKTYAEISEHDIKHKVALSQSTKAMLAFVEYLATERTPILWK